MDGWISGEEVEAWSERVEQNQSLVAAHFKQARRFSSQKVNRARISLISRDN